MKKIKSIVATILLLSGTIVTAATSKIQQATPSTPTASYSVNPVYPTQVYCPTGQVCNFPGPLVIISVKQ